MTRNGVKIGEYLLHSRCRFCYQNKLKEIIDFGNVPLAGGFLPKTSTVNDFINEKLYPLKIQYCTNCHLVQVNTIVPTEVLYKDYFYFSSAIQALVNHFDLYAKELATQFKVPSKALVVEIGCNDGVFLKPLKREGFKVVGVDPARNVVEPLIKQSFNIEIAGFDDLSAKTVSKKYGKADIILSSNSFAHIDNMRAVVQGVKDLLKPNGFFASEVHYLKTLIDERQYDMMYHDHMSYYSLLTLQKVFKQFDMEIFDVRPIPIHAGSRRFYVQHKRTGKNKINKTVRLMNKQEISRGLNSLSTYLKYYRAIDKTRVDLVKLLNKIKTHKQNIIGYGASGRATQLMSFCKLDRSLLDYVVDDAPAKLGAFTPGNHLQIRSSQILSDKKKRPDYVLLFAWSFFKEIASKQEAYLKSGGKFIVPLPSVRVIDWSAYQLLKDDKK